MKQPAATHTNLNPSENASNNPPKPAPIICRVTPGTVASAVSLLATKSPMKEGRELGGRPRGSTAPAILGPRLDQNLAVKIALSDSEFSKSL